MSCQPKIYYAAHHIIIIQCKRENGKNGAEQSRVNGPFYNDHDHPCKLSQILELFGWLGGVILSRCKGHWMTQMYPLHFLCVRIGMISALTQRDVM